MCLKGTDIAVRLSRPVCVSSILGRLSLGAASSDAVLNAFVASRADVAIPLRITGEGAHTCGTLTRHLIHRLFRRVY